MASTQRPHRVLLWLLFCSAGLTPVAGFTDDTAAQDDTQMDHQQKLLDWSRKYVKGRRVAVLSGKADQIGELKAMRL